MILSNTVFTRQSGCPKSPQPAQKVASKTDLLGKAGAVVTCYTGGYLLTMRPGGKLLAKSLVSEFARFRG